jgi:hypothetical protein
VNAAFLLVATAFVTGSDPVQPVPAPVAPAPIVSSGCSSCDTGCNTCDSGHKWFGGFRGLFSKNDCGCDSCGGGKRFLGGHGGGCGCGGGFSLGLKERFSGFGHKSCDTCNTCNDCGHHEKSCGCGIMESPLSRLGGLFRKHKGCDTCDTCNTCSTCGSNGAIIQGAPAPAGPAVKPVPAPAAAPQKMPAPPPVKPVTSQLTPTSTLIIE